MTKLISYVLLLCFMIMELSSVATVLADERNAKAAERKWMQDAGAGLVDWAGQYKELDENTVPKAVGYENAKWKNHIERLYDEEGKDLNRVVFKNADGTRTQYIFDYPVKYKDKDGKIKDSSLKIKENNSGKYKFQTEAGVSTAMFPTSMQEGIVLEGNDTQIRMVLHNVKSVHPKRLDEETISYKYDAHTTVEYSLTYTGFKEDIVVHTYTGQTEYDFTLYTGGLELKEIDGSFYIVDENGEEKATIGDIIIFTADEKNNTLGELRAVEVVKNQEYRLTIVLDPEYLASPETVYPIRIDPTIEITYDNNGAGAIEDVTINSLKGSSGTSKSLSVGLREKYGISRILMKFPGLDLSKIGAHTKITNATVELRDLLCEGTYLTVSCHAFAGNEWTESTANWSNVSPNSISTFLSSQTISYYNGVKLSPKHRYSFDITEVVKGWKTGNYNQNKGIIFKASSTLENGSTYDCRTIASYNRSSNKPTLTVTYDSTPSSYQLITDGTYYLNNKYSGNYLKYMSLVLKGESGLLDSLGDYIKWEIRSVDGGYVIYSTADMKKYLGGLVLRQV
ncbi:MAG: DNRLRE domain-containing protein [Agathobacter sp.]|nr:DNRLRE domain-containing protein [Agathobacter sp.]